MTMRYPTAAATPKQLALLCIVIFSFLASLPANAASENNWAFDVYLDNKRIGEHLFSVQRGADSKTVTTTADFDVKIFFVTAFSYEHENTETWQNGCLTGIEASTVVNGDLSVVEGKQVNGALSLSTNNNSRNLDGCVSTFAYWDQDFLAESQLLNSQTGELEPITVANLGSDQYQLSNQTLDATRYQIMVDETPIDLWYAEDGRWLGLETLAKGGRVLRYEPTELPQSPISDTGD